MKILLLLTCLNLDLITIADFSGSVHNYEEVLCSGIEQIISIQDEEMRQALIQFSTLAGVAFTFNEKREFECYQAGGTTNLLGALYLALETFNSSPRDAGKVIVIISDGIPDNGSKQICLRVAEQLKSLGIKIYGVLINSDTNSEEFMQSISDVYVSTNYNNLITEIKKLNFCL